MQNAMFYGLAVASTISYAVLPVIAKKIGITIPPFGFIAISMAVLSVLAFGASLTFERSFSFASISVTHLFLLVFFGAINLAAFSLYLRAIQGVPVGHYQLIYGALSPLLTVGLAFLLIGETVSMRFFLAVPLILAGLYVAFGM